MSLHMVGQLVELNQVLQPEAVINNLSRLSGEPLFSHSLVNKLEVEDGKTGSNPVSGKPPSLMGMESRNAQSGNSQWFPSPSIPSFPFCALLLFFLHKLPC